MAELGQQSLMEAPKPKGLHVPAGCVAWWGVDGGAGRVSIGVAVERPDGSVGRLVRSVGVGGDGAPRLASLHAEVVDLAHQLALVAPPGIVGVEQPAPAHGEVNHALEFGVGVAIAAVWIGVREVLEHGPPRVELIVGSWWKSRACGDGSISKTRKVEGRRTRRPVGLEEYAVTKWARLNGYTGSSVDEVDALAMAEAMRREWRLIER